MCEDLRLQGPLLGDVVLVAPERSHLKLRAVGGLGGKEEEECRDPTCNSDFVASLSREGTLRFQMSCSAVPTRSRLVGQDGHMTEMKR